eukprot:Blabericola_migrator_1__1332@NODE_1346_length_4755_cov_308_469710_g903_i0_p2_GENE_NODE_1346_length_4755_cov_308_469710_g903_i0NODE_1346_length_4755_cov_308_469710_g903_i0_p2_ORF_typecomplete_len541_score85_21UDPGT/PF00201_18/1_2e39Glyco_tran_28_C/PF04101_16/1_2e05Glyco_trans_1_3/PF13528_6/5_7e02Glyco_trans_1_3/PF13528_6/0_016_NODE_1346_length_4755_cov_308_469710_g903_i09742596
MAHVFITSWGAPGHINPIKQLASALRDKVHVTLGVMLNENTDKKVKLPDDALIFNKISMREWVSDSDGCSDIIAADFIRQLAARPPIHAVIHDILTPFGFKIAARLNIPYYTFMPSPLLCLTALLGADLTVVGRGRLVGKMRTEKGDLKTDHHEDRASICDCSGNKGDGDAKCEDFEKTVDGCGCGCGLEGDGCEKALDQCDCGTDKGELGAPRGCVKPVHNCQASGGDRSLYCPASKSEQIILEKEAVKGEQPRTPDFKRRVGFENFNEENPMDKWFLTIATNIHKFAAKCNGLIVNDIAGFYPAPPPSPHIYFCGPLVPEPAKIAFSYLDSCPLRSVLFVSLGSSWRLKNQDLVELAHGLALTRQKFLWSHRGPDWSVDPFPEWAPPDVPASEPVEANGLPQGFEDMVKDQGMIVAWINQAAVLTHPAVCGFITHCGWNSLLEAIALAEGIPLILLPIGGDQVMNAQLMERLGCGQSLWHEGRGLERECVKKDIVCALDDEELRANALKVHHMAVEAMEGTSKADLERLKCVLCEGDV